MMGRGDLSSAQPAPGHDGGVTSVLSQATPGHVFLILVCQTSAIVRLPWSQTMRAELKGGDSVG